MKTCVVPNLNPAIIGIFTLWVIVFLNPDLWNSAPEEGQCENVKTHHKLNSARLINLITLFIQSQTLSRAFKQMHKSAV